MTEHPYSSSSLDRICVPVLGLGTPPKRLCLSNSPTFYIETAKFWDRNMHSTFIHGLNTCALEIVDLTSLLVTGCIQRLFFLLLPSVHKCQQENEQAKPETLYSLHLIHYAGLSNYPFSLLFPLRQLFILYPAGAINEKNKDKLGPLVLSNAETPQLSNRYSGKERYLCASSFGTVIAAA